MEHDQHSAIEDALRALAAATSSARLYPPSSALPREAIAKFVDRAMDATRTGGPIRYVVDPHAIRIGEREITSGQGQVSAFAESLYALQVGQLIIAPGVSADETAAFVDIVNQDVRVVRDDGGLRIALGAAGVSRIAVIEVTLKASEEEGLIGLDLISSPLEDIGRETVAASERWAEQARKGRAHDEVAETVGGLEEAAREIATKRMSEALMRLDESSRMRVLALALQADTNGQRMEGTLSIIADMKPAALARLLTIVAAQAETEPGRVAAAIDLPPEVAAQVALLLAPSPRTEAECGVPPEVDTENIAQDMAEESDTSDLRRQIAVASPGLAAGKALATTVAISRTEPSEDSVKAIGEALPNAARDGAFRSTREALRRLTELGEDPALSMSVERARMTLHEPEVLAAVCRAPMTDSDAAMAGEILTAAGTAGAEALINCLATSNPERKSLLHPVLRGMGESFLAVASRVVQGDDATRAISVLDVLPTMGDRRAVSVIEKALANLDVTVRLAAVSALAIISDPSGQTALAKALGHWDPQTQREVVTEIGRIRSSVAIPALVRILGDINVFERNHELKKEVIKSLESIGSSDALPVLRRMARRKLVFGKKNKELRFLAKRAVARLGQDATEPQGAIRRD